MLSLAGTVFAIALACTPSGGTDVMRLVASGVPGGALLSVWADPASTRGSPHGYVVGGYVGVPHAQITDGRVGRLVEYVGRDFRTLCTTDEVLWWVTGVRDEAGDLTVYAVGENGRVLRYRRGGCETLGTRASHPPEGAPTYWGARAVGPDELWLVGGSANPAGPKGVVTHYVSGAFSAVAVPSSARVDLYKIDVARDGALVVVGARGVVLERPRGVESTFVDVHAPVRADDNRLFTVACDPASSLAREIDCLAVGGAGTGTMLARSRGLWRSIESLNGTAIEEQTPALNGAAIIRGLGAFVVGSRGFVLHTTGQTSLRANPLTPATLHGVGGFLDHVVAVGGELSTSDTTQRAVILVQDTLGGNYRFDGVEYVSEGALRSSLGGAGQGGGLSSPVFVNEGSPCDPSAGGAGYQCAVGLRCTASTDGGSGVCVREDAGIEREAATRNDAVSDVADAAVADATAPMDASEARDAVVPEPLDR